MVGTVRPKQGTEIGYKKQWRWRCTFRDCLDVCKKLWPHNCKVTVILKSNKSLRAYIAGL